MLNQTQIIDKSLMLNHIYRYKSEARRITLFDLWSLMTSLLLGSVNANSYQYREIQMYPLLETQVKPPSKTCNHLFTQV